jgi:anti-sigma factor RsiW
MSGCDEQLLGAYFDAELNADQRARVSAHLLSCADCSRKLERIGQSSAMLRQIALPAMSGRELQELHDAIDAAADRPVWRIGGSMGLIAASILVIGLTWLNVLPARSSQPAPQPSNASLARAPLEDWERVAITLRAGPLVEQRDPLDVRYASATPRYDAQLADDMLEQLSDRDR